MSWTCPGYYKVHVHERDSSGRSVHGHCPVPLPALPPPPALGAFTARSVECSPAIDQSSSHIVSSGIKDCPVIVLTAPAFPCSV